MAGYTPNHNLRKIDLTDSPPDITALNPNFDTIDTELKKLADNKVNVQTGKGLSTNDYTTTDKNKLAGVEAGAQVNKVTSVAGKTGAVALAGTDIPAATTGARGTVQLSTSTASTSTSLAATPSAVKSAYDKAVSAESKAGSVETSLGEHKAEIATDTEYGHIRLSDTISKSKGFRVLTTDPINPKEGEMWLNSTEKTIKTVIDGVITPTNLVKQVYLLNNGLENVEWVTGLTAGTVTKRTDSFRLTTTSEVSISTKNKIDLSRVVKILVDWENSTADAGGRAHFVIGAMTNTPWNNFEAIVNHTNKFSRTIDEIVVGGLNGEYFIRLHADSMLSSQVNVDIYSVWLVY